jgi:hypothetical protein
MRSDPVDSPAQLVSLFQSNAVALRATCFAWWHALEGSVVVINSVDL